jgi:L-fuculose-phosphate aldolase
LVPDESRLRIEICEYAALLWARGLIGGIEGNLSVRLEEHLFLCTPSGLAKGHLKPNQLVLVDLHGNQQGSHGGRMGFRDQGLAGTALKVSSEFKMHLGIYQARPDVSAVVHAHPPFATSYAYAEVPLDLSSSPEGAYVVGQPALLPFATPGTDEVPASFLPFLPSHNAFLLARHGATTVGSSLEEAFNRMETLERLAQVMYQARILCQS